VSGILDKQEMVIDIFVHIRGIIHCNNNLLYWVLWMTKTLQDMQVKYDDPISILFENTSSIIISKNTVMHSKLKHIPIKYHLLWEHYKKNNIKIEYVGKKEKITYIFTKSLARKHFEYLRQKMGVVSSPQ
jgi:hypothetical protein